MKPAGYQFRIFFRINLHRSRIRESGRGGVLHHSPKPTDQPRKLLNDGIFPILQVP